jgi:hypothetical protein
MNNTTSLKYHILFFFFFLSSSFYASSLPLFLISIAIDWQCRASSLSLHSMQGLFLDSGFSELIALALEFFLLSGVGMVIAMHGFAKLVRRRQGFLKLKKATHRLSWLPA